MRRDFSQIQSNLGLRPPRITNNSVYEQIFRTQIVSDDVLCLELRTRKPSTSWSVKLGVSMSAVFVEDLSSGKYEWETPIVESVSCCATFVHSNSQWLLLCLVFFFINLTKLILYICILSHIVISPSLSFSVFVRLVNVMKYFIVFSTLVTFKIFTITTCFGLNWTSSGVNICF
jgi:hypothetical protein